MSVAVLETSVHRLFTGQELIEHCRDTPIVGGSKEEG